MTAAEV